MTTRRLVAAGAACVAIVLLAMAALTVRRSRAEVRPTVEPDTAIGPLVNGALNNRVITYEGKRYFYKVFLPHDFTTARTWPVIFALHGGRTRGVDNVVQAREGLGNVIRDQLSTFPAVVIFPQVPTRARGLDFIPVDDAMIEREMRDLHGDRDRLYLTGSSFGGFTIFQMAFTHPERYAALVPVSTGIDLSIVPGGQDAGHDSVYGAVAARLHDIPIWIFHGELDEELGVDAVRRIVQVFKQAGVNIRYTEFEKSPHSIFARPWQTPELVSWLLEQKRGRTGS
ncbi:MAG: hypothetical protein ABI664_11310 [bacterium]